ncbi:MAG: helix-turn-helix transcriptional regulator, partial [Pseudomonadota bacterium]
HAPNSLSEVVAELIRLQLRKGKVSMERAARSLDMGPRKLRREMDREGTTFRECTKRVRTITAKELLVETDLAFSTISTDLGYANPSLFTRAFARDVGQTPSNFRATGTRKHKLGRPENLAGQ